MIRNWIWAHLEQQHLEPEQSVPQEGVVQPPDVEQPAGDIHGADETSETQPAQHQEGDEQKE